MYTWAGTLLHLVCLRETLTLPFSVSADDKSFCCDNDVDVQ